MLTRSLVYGVSQLLALGETAMVFGILRWWGFSPNATLWISSLFWVGASLLMLIVLAMCVISGDEAAKERARYPDRQL